MELIEKNIKIFTWLGIVAFVVGIFLYWSGDPSMPPTQSEIFLGNIGRIIIYMGLAVIIVAILLNSRKRTNE